MAVLVDTGVLFALLDKDDIHHAAAKKLFEEGAGPFLIPTVILPEVCYLTHKYLGPKVELAFLEGLLQGELPLEWGKPEDLSRSVEILRARPEFGMVDAMVMAVAERLKIVRIATIDHRHFGHFKPRHCQAFELLPGIASRNS